MSYIFRALSERFALRSSADKWKKICSSRDLGVTLVFVQSCDHHPNNGSVFGTFSSSFSSNFGMRIIPCDEGALCWMLRASPSSRVGGVTPGGGGGAVGGAAGGGVSVLRGLVDAHDDAAETARPRVAHRVQDRLDEHLPDALHTQQLDLLQMSGIMNGSGAMKISCQTSQFHKETLRARSLAISSLKKQCAPFIKRRGACVLHVV